MIRISWLFGFLCVRLDLWPLKGFVRLLNMLTQEDLEELLERHQLLGNDLSAQYSQQELIELFSQASIHFTTVGTVLDISTPAFVFGDIHGEFHHLLRILIGLDFRNSDRKFLFLGDFVDRGHFGVEVLVFLTALSMVRPEKFFLVRGNHEEMRQNKRCNFYKQVTDRGFSIELLDRIETFYNVLPLAAVVEETCLCLHGGLPEGLQSIQDIRQIRLPVDIQRHNFAYQILWNDPSERIGWTPNSRTIRGQRRAKCFGPDIFRKTMDTIGMNYLIRAHQFAPNGIHRMFNKRF